MSAFEFSYIANLPDDQGDPHLLALVDTFNHGRPTGAARPLAMTWNSAWQQLMRVAIYQKGPLLSEIGAPWTSDFVGMNSLRAFQPDEAARMGGEAAFVLGAWRNCQAAPGRPIWGIPARVDARVIYYWRDMLEQAGVDPQAAFATPAQFEDTLARLQAAGFERPLAWIADASRNSVYQAATWIWAAGGEVIDADGSLAFTRPEAQAGLAAYFRLHPYLANPSEHPNAHFLQRRCAVAFHNRSVLNNFRAGTHLPWSPQTDDLLGVALPPGPSFMGGTNLVIWRHAAPEQAGHALALVTALVTAPQFTRFCLDSGYMPSRQEAVDALRRQGDPRTQVMVRAIETGRTGSTAHLWVLVAERLGAALGSIWSALAEDPAQDVPALVARLTGTAAARLEQSLS